MASNPIAMASNLINSNGFVLLFAEQLETQVTIAENLSHARHPKGIYRENLHEDKRLRDACKDRCREGVGSTWDQSCDRFLIPGMAKMQSLPGALTTPHVLCIHDLVACGLC